MGIQKDAGEILLFLYKKKIEGEETPQLDDIQNETNWERDRVIFALEYLIDKYLIKGKALGEAGTSKTVFVLINGIYPDGIDIIENEKEFKKQFNFGVNLGLITFSWGATDK